MHPIFNSYSSQKGAVLLEGLISILILSFGILSLVGLQAVLLEQSIQAKYRTIAVYLSSQLEGQMWLDVSNLNSYSITDNSCSYVGCSSWVTEVAAKLPNGSSNVVVNGSNVTITLQWRSTDNKSQVHVPGKEVASSIAGQTTTNQYVVNTVITPSVMN